MGPPRALFLASTVSALHRNAHIWNASHPLLVNYYCSVIVYSLSMEGQKEVTYNDHAPGIEQGSTTQTKKAFAVFAIQSVVPNGSYC